MTDNFGGLRLNKTRKTEIIVDPLVYDLGVYLWQMPDGSCVSDDDRNFLSIASQRGDLKKLNILMNTVKDFGITEGKPLFLPGHTKITDEQYEEQKARLNAGLTPDPLDVSADMDELRARRQRDK